MAIAIGKIWSVVTPELQFKVKVKWVLNQQLKAQEVGKEITFTNPKDHISQKLKKSQKAAIIFRNNLVLPVLFKVDNMVEVVSEIKQ